MKNVEKKNRSLVVAAGFKSFVMLFVIVILLTGSMLGPYSVFVMFGKGMFSIPGNYWQLFMIFTGLLFFLLFTFRKELFLDLSDYKISVFLFVFSFLLRIIVAFLYSPVPVSDFDFYYHVGEWFVRGDYSAIADRIAQYQIPSFGGLALLNTFLTGLFSHELLGQQVANAFMTSLSCVCIFYIGKRIKRNIGIAGAVIYALYPSNIIMTQVCTNQHGASLMYLLAALCVFEVKKSNTVKKRILYSVLTGVCTSFGYFFHPSAIIVILTMVCWSIICILQDGRGEWKRHAADFAIVLVTYIVIIKLAIMCFLRIGIISSTETPPILPRLAIGLNQETIGQWSADDLQAIAEAEDKDEFAKQLIAERIKEPIKVLDLYWKKINILLFSQDGSFMWYKYGEDVELQEMDISDIRYAEKQEHYACISAFTESIGRWDQYYVLVIYFLAIVGLFTMFVLKKNTNIWSYILIEICGWVCVFVLAEVQPRYRYFIMPELVIAAGYGACFLYHSILILRRKICDLLKVKGMS